MIEVFIVGAGKGGKVVKQIFIAMNGVMSPYQEQYFVAGFIDDAPGLSRGNPTPDSSYIISISSNLQVRRNKFEKYADEEFVNAVHPTAYIDPTAKIGVGNIIGAFVYVGPFSKIGDNNLISSHCSIEHDNKIGSHNVFGPGCVTSGSVIIGNSCLFGAGVQTTNGLTIEDNVFVAAGLTVWRNLEDEEKLRYKLIPDRKEKQ